MPRYIEENNNTPTWIVWVVWGVFIAFVSFSVGKVYGQIQQQRFEDEVECEAGYSNSNLNEIPAKCLKYFEIKIK